MERILSYHITAAAAGLSVNQFLRNQGYSRHVITCLKQTAAGITLNQSRTRTTQLLQSGDHLVTRIAETAASENIEPVALPLEIIYEDEDLMVINKRADTPIHPSPGNYRNTLANAAAYYFAAQNRPFVYRCINRLDRDTTGLLILAKHMLSGAILSKMIKEHRIRRTYLALVTGCPAAAGTVRAAIGRRPGSIISRQVDPAGEHAVTHYQRIAAFEDYSLLQLQLETGRTHQIRIHMSHIGHPLLGDSLYNPGNTALGRQALHSETLVFEHPLTGRTMHFQCPLPDDMKALCGNYSAIPSGFAAPRQHEDTC